MLWKEVDVLSVYESALAPSIFANDECQLNENVFC